MKKIFKNFIFLFIVLLLGNQSVYGGDSDSSLSTNDFSSPGFMVSVKNLVGIGKDVIVGGDLETKSNNLFAEIINILIIAIGVIALFVMVVGAGFMIFYNGQDDILNKGKQMFMTGIIGLFLALSSYYIIALIKYFIYQ